MRRPARRPVAISRRGFLAGAALLGAALLGAALAAGTLQGRVTTANAIRPPLLAGHLSRSAWPRGTAFAGLEADGPS